MLGGQLDGHCAAVRLAHAEALGRLSVTGRLAGALHCPPPPAPYPGLAPHHRAAKDTVTDRPAPIEVALVREEVSDPSIAID